jgi:hypothetical protein
VQIALYMKRDLCVRQAQRTSCAHIALLLFSAHLETVSNNVTKEQQDKKLLSVDCLKKSHTRFLRANYRCLAFVNTRDLH